MKSIYLLSFICLLFSCKQQSNDVINQPIETEEQKQEVLKKIEINYSTPEQVGTSDYYVLFLNTKKDRKNAKLSSSPYKSHEPYNHWNMVFYNDRTREHHLLSEDRILIHETYFENKEKQSNYKTKRINGKIIYKATTADFNNDGKLNHKDPKYLLISNEDGRELQAISPEGEDLINYKVKEDGSMFLSTYRDTNKDLKFERGTDEKVWYDATLVNNKWELKELLNNADRKAIREKFLTQWITK